MAGVTARLVPLGVLAAALLGGCLGLVPDAGAPASMGDPSDGVLRRGESLPNRREGMVRARPGDATRFGARRLVGAIERAAAAVYRAFPGSHPLRVGDLSWPGGGRHPRHNSHRTGRDVDLLFYAVNAAGRPVRSRGWLAFDRFGAARETRAPAGMTPSGQLFLFDDARNWHLVRTLLLDEDARVQWIFCSRGLKARLLRYGAVHERDPDALFRATWVLHQPSSGRPHDDHFHVRVMCDPTERALGCQNRVPTWPWLRASVGKEAAPGRTLDDAMLTRLLLEPMQ